MECLIPFLLFLAFAITTPAMGYSIATDPFYIAQNPCNDPNIADKQMGHICKDCGTLGFCVQQYNAWTTLDVMNCDTARNFYCDETVAGCVYKADNTCDVISKGPQFKCQQPGLYPDPFYCKYFHICNDKLEDRRVVCPAGTAYSVVTETCSLSSNDAICFEPQYNCDTFGYKAAWSIDSTIYYECNFESTQGVIVRYPLLRRCQNGYRFIGGKCTTTSTIIPTTQLPQTGCVAGLSPDPTDSSSYFYCYNGKLEKYTCPNGTYFNATTNACTF